MDVAQYMEILVAKLKTWSEEAVAILPNAVVAVLVLAAFLLLGRVVGKLVERALRRVSESEATVKLFAAIARLVLAIAGLFFALNILQLDKAVISLIASVGVIGLALGFAFQDLAANFIAGVIMGFRKPFRIGDLVKTGDHLGTVRKLDMRNTLIQTFEGPMVIMPNKSVFESPLINYSVVGVRRIDIDVGVTYDADLELVTRTLREAVSGFDFLAPGRTVEVYARQFGASSIDFSLRYWVPYPGQKDFLLARHEGLLAIKKAFDRAGITIPFPIRTLDFSLTEQSAARVSVDGARPA